MVVGDARTSDAPSPDRRSVTATRSAAHRDATCAAVTLVEVRLFPIVMVTFDRRAPHFSRANVYARARATMSTREQRGTASQTVTNSDRRHSTINSDCVVSRDTRYSTVCARARLPRQASILCDTCTERIYSHRKSNGSPNSTFVLP